MGRKKRGLGNRGLNVLLNSQARAQAVTTPDDAHAVVDKPVSSLRPGRYQPRQQFNQLALETLAESIRAQGIVQPLVVRPVEEGQFEIIAGERRWRAAQLAGLETVPVLVREIDDQQALAIALIENIQREDLNPIEQAQGMQRLIDEFELTHDALAEVLGLSRAQVTNLLRLLKLPEMVQVWVHDGLLGMGHARALLPLSPSQQIQVGQKAIDQSWTVRQVETHVRQLLAQSEEKHTPQPQKKDPNIAALETRLSEQLGARVAIHHQAKGRGRIEIRYSDLDELQRLLDQLQGGRYSE